MITGLLSLLIIIVVILFIAWLITFVVQRYLPFEAGIKQIIVAFVWLIAVIAIILKLVPFLGIAGL